MAMMRKGNGTGGGIGRRTMRNSLNFGTTLPDESMNV